MKNLSYKRIVLNVTSTSLLVFSGTLFSADIVSDQNSAAQHQAGVTTTSSGVPMVNIVAPNSSGLSHNKFDSYSVTPKHLIINNSLQSTKTLISNTVRANPNLNGRAASVILNEVTGANRTQLRGYSEIAGQKAELVIANPNGITCQGCGFINTPRVVLSTGTPNIQNNRLMSLTVNQGDIALTGDSINTGNVEQFDLITRSVHIGTSVLAKKLNVITGTNTVNYNTLAVTPNTSAGSKPQTAIDSSLVGGMYANTISLISTESGIGVKFDGEMATNTGDVTLSADGEITINHANSAQNLNISSNNNINTKQLLYGQNIQLNTSKTITNSGLVAASKSIATQSNTLNNQKDILVGLNPNGNLNNLGNANISTTTTINNSGQVIATQDLTITADTINNNNALMNSGNNLTINTTNYVAKEKHGLSAGKKLIINATNFNNAVDFGVDSNLQLNLTQKFTNTGALSTTGSLTLNANEYQNKSTGKLTVDGISQVEIKNDLNHAGIFKGNSQTTINATNVNNTGVIASASDLTIKATNTLTNGSAQSDSSVNALIFSVGKMSLFSNVLNNVYSDIYSVGDLTIAKNVQNALNTQVNNLSSGMESNGNLSIFTQSLKNKREPIQITDDFSLCQNVSDVLAFLCNSNILGVQSTGIISNMPWLFDETFQFWKQKLSQIDQQTVIYNLINRVLKASIRTPSITAGKNLTITAGDVFNQAGLLSAGNNIQIDTTNFEQRTVTAALPYPIPLDLLTDPFGLNSDRFIRGIEGNGYSADDLARYNQLKSCCSYLDDDFYIHHISTVTNHLPVANGLFNFLTESELITLAGDDSNRQNFYTHREFLDYLIQLDQVDQARLSLLSKSHWENSLNLSQSVFKEYKTDLLSFKNNHTIIENSHYLRFRHSGSFYEESDPYTPVVSLPEVRLYRKIVDYALFSATLTAGNNIAINAINNIDLGVSQISPVQSSTAPNVNLTSAQVSSNSTANTSLSNSTSSQLIGSDSRFQGLANAIPPASHFTAVSVDTRIPTSSGLFSTTNSDGFLVTTNESVASFIDSFGSDFLLQELGYNPDKVSKRLGDGFYESTLIRKTVQQQTGRRFLNDAITSDKQQFRYLMNNAIASQKVLNLSLGVSLSAMQVAALTHDMMWLEEQIVQGQKVLVPVLYLASLREGDLNAKGTVNAKNISFNSKNFNNQTIVVAQNNLNVNTRGKFTNLNALISGGNMVVKSGDSVVNNGLLSSDRSIFLSTGGSLLSTTYGQNSIIAKNDVNLNVAKNLITTNTLIKSQNIQAVVGGDIDLTSTQLIAQNNLNIQGQKGLKASNSLLKSQNNLQAATQGNIDLNNTQVVSSNVVLSSEQGSLINRNKTQLKAKDNLYLKAQGDIQTTESINVNESLNIHAGRDFINKGKNIDAGKDITLSAGRDIVLDSVTVKKIIKPASQSQIMPSQSKVQHLFGAVPRSQSKATPAVIKETVIASRLNAKGNVNLISGRNLGINNTDIIANENIALNAKGNTTITNANNKIQAGKNLTINSQINPDGSIGVRQGGDVTITGSPLTSGGSMSIAGNDIKLNTKQTKTQTGSEDDLKRTLRHKGSNLQAKGNIAINASRDLTIKASEVNAKNNVSLNAKGETLIANEQNEDYSYNKTTKKIKKRKGGGRKTTIRESLKRTNVESKIIAGNNVTINSKLNNDGSIATRNSGALTVVSSDIQGNGNVVMSGDGVNVLS
ncbi:MAG: filamentous hemagglutinin N-terminal domain-containing protein, partial [Methylococcales bacterium]|nr:filamentous hemagglutinin N-terminal domain-containing protein [Methylococcales bacterium]